MLKFMLKKRISLIMVLVFALLMSTITGCSSTATSTTGGSSSGGAKSPIKIGFSAPLTGNCAKAGQDMVNGAQLAVDEINAAGGVLGTTLELVAEDDGGDPQQAVQGANKLISKNVDAAIGYYNSGACNATLSVWNKAGMPTILVAVSANILTRQGFKNVFRVQGYTDQQAEVGVDCMLNKFDSKKVAIITDNTAGPRGIADVSAELVKKANPEVEIFREELTPGEKDFSGVVAKLKEFNPDSIYWTGFYAEGSLLVKQVRSAGITVPFLAGDGSADPQFMAVAGADAEGVIMTTPPMSETLPAAKAFIDNYTKKYNIEPATFSVYAYDAIKLYADALTRANAADKAAVITALSGTKDFKALTGDISFDENGDLTHPGYTLLVVKNGKLTAFEQ